MQCYGSIAIGRPGDGHTFVFQTVGQKCSFLHLVSPAAERLRYILSEDDDFPTPTLFTEMDTLQREGEELEWKESAR